MAAPLIEPPPRLKWTAFVKDFVRAWEQGEHVSIIGPTGQGKSVLLRALLKERARRRSAHIIVFATKPRDKTMTGFRWPIIHDWPPGYGQNQIILWPPYGDPLTAASRQRRVFAPILRQVFSDGNRTVVFDEAADFEDRLGLKTLVNEYWRMARSMKLTVVAGTQRPVGVTRLMFSMPSWIFFFHTTDEDELRRVGEIGGIDKRYVQDVVRNLDEHEFLCIRPRKREMYRSKVRLRK